MTGRFPFNVRVYGLLIEDGKVLIADERVQGRLITKFPGGGLEFGEGPAECVVREFEEELELNVKVLRHFYTTDFFQRSAFRDDDQMISIYYLVEALEPIKIELRTNAFDLGEEEESAFRWSIIKECAIEEITFPIDKKVLELLKETY